MPFQTTVLGVQVTVERVDLNESDEIVAVCTRGRSRQSLPILDLPLPTPPPDVRSGLRPTAAFGVRKDEPMGGSETVMSIEDRARARLAKNVVREEARRRAPAERSDCAPGGGAAPGGAE